MELQWCWRCRAEVPMFDERQFAELHELFAEGMRATKEFRQRYGLPLDVCPIEDRFRPLVDRHEVLTGVRETCYNAIMHHHLALYGPPCPACGKLLRTPQASRCFNCGFIVRSAP